MSSFLAIRNYESYMHKASVVSEPIYTDFQAVANLKLEKCSAKRWIAHPSSLGLFSHNQKIERISTKIRN